MSMSVEDCPNIIDTGSDLWRSNVDFVPPVEATARYKRLGASATRMLGESITDSLTGLPNAEILDMRLDMLIARENGKIETGRNLDGHTEDPNFALLCIDIDSFKKVNDNLGHAEGDNVLRIIAEALNRGRSGDIAVHSSQSDTDDGVDSGIDEEASQQAIRVHGDEMYIIISELTPKNPSNPNLTPDQRLDAIVRRKKEDVQAALGETEHAASFLEWGVGVSIGAVRYRRGMNKQELIDESDALMYEDKQRNNGSR